MNIEEDDLVRPVHDVGDRLGYVHIGENHRGYLGSGHLDFSAVLPRPGRHRLHRTDHIRVVLLRRGVAHGLSNDLAIWRNLWNDGPALAAHAQAYLSNALGVTGAGR